MGTIIRTNLYRTMYRVDNAMMMTDLYMELLSEYEEQGFSYEEASEKAYYEEIEVLKQQADLKRKEQLENEIH